jgi:hypothetical protein
MRILLSYASEYNKGEGGHFARVLRRLGHSVEVVNVASAHGKSSDDVMAVKGFHGTTDLGDLIRMLDGEGPFLFLYIEPLGLIPRGMESAPFPTACVISDVHRDLKSRRRLARFFDHIFLYHRNYLSAFDDHPADHVHWLPYACDLDLFKPLGVTRDLDVAFVGQLFSADSERSRIIKSLARRWSVNEQRYYRQEEIPAVYSRARIVINLPLADDLSFRTFEALSCGALLLTRRVANGQEVLFEEGKHYVAFGNEQELFEKIEYYLSHESEREAIAQAGHAEAAARHGLDKRLATLLEDIQENPSPAAPVRRMTRGELDRQYAWLYMYWRSVDTVLALVQEARRAGRPWLSLFLRAGEAFARKTVRAVL